MRVLFCCVEQVVVLVGLPSVGALVCVRRAGGRDWLRFGFCLILPYPVQFSSAVLAILSLRLPLLRLIAFETLLFVLRSTPHAHTPCAMSHASRPLNLLLENSQSLQPLLSRSIVLRARLLGYLVPCGLKGGVGERLALRALFDLLRRVPGALPSLVPGQAWPACCRHPLHLRIAPSPTNQPLVASHQLLNSRRPLRYLVPRPIA